VETRNRQKKGSEKKKMNHSRRPSGKTVVHKKWLKNPGHSWGREGREKGKGSNVKKAKVYQNRGWSGKPQETLGGGKPIRGKQQKAKKGQNSI